MTGHSLYLIISESLANGFTQFGQSHFFVYTGFIPTSNVNWVYIMQSIIHRSSLAYILQVNRLDSERRKGE